MNRFTLRLPDDLGAFPKPGYGWCEIADRLADYEDTGLEPEEVRGIKTAYDEVQSGKTISCRICWLDYLKQEVKDNA